MILYIIPLLIFTILLLISIFTNVKIPLVDGIVVYFLGIYIIKKKRLKNNIVHNGWKMVHYDIDKQDFRWQYNENGSLVAKLRIRSNLGGVYSAYQGRWISDKKDVLEEVNIDGEPSYLLKLFGMNKNMKVVNVSNNKKLRKVFGDVDHDVIMMTGTKLKHG